MDKINENLSLPNGRQIRGARALLGFTQEHCSRAAGVALSSYKRYEHTNDSQILLIELKYRTVIAVVDYFLSCGIQFGNSEQIVFVSFDPSKAVEK